MDALCALKACSCYIGPNATASPRVEFAAIIFKID